VTAGTFNLVKMQTHPRQVGLAKD